MSTKERLRRGIVAQFHNPTGVAGHVAGWIMGHRASNVARNRWAVELLEIESGDRVLELGCGPGVALAAIADRLLDGVAVGVDQSAVMVRHAQRRNATAIWTGRVHPVQIAVEDLLPVDSEREGPSPTETPPLNEPFDVVLAVNNVGVWDQPSLRLVALRDLMRPGARIALVSQPRCPGATAATSQAAAIELADLLDNAGYTAITPATLDLSPPAVCVRATTARTH